MSLVIRPALRTDAQQILDFITELAEYERAREEVLATTQDIERSLFDADISPTDRGDGAGRQLLRYIAKQAVAKGCGRLEWSVLDWNEPAIGFYDALGAQPQTEWLRYRLDGERLIAFAQQ